MEVWHFFFKFSVQNFSLSLFQASLYLNGQQASSLLFISSLIHLHIKLNRVIILVEPYNCYIMKIPSEEQSPRKEKKGVSRRTFLRGAGLTTAGTVALSAGLLSFKLEESTTPPAILGPGEAEVQFVVNGQARSVWVEPRTTLAEALRDHLSLTGTKVVCDRGSCSACTVWLDGKPVNSCMTLAVDVAGREVTTVEGLAQGGALHPVQEAFIEHDASMCGFCTPGMVMSCAALLKRNANPTLEDVKSATSGNLCRCGTYPKVFEATLDEAKKMKQ